MPDPISFTSASPRYTLPLLFPGQTQKEFFVNEAHARIDALLHPAVEGEADEPPASPTEGECWLVAPAPGGEWTDHAGQLACRSASGWLFVEPRDGMRLLDRSTGQLRLYRDGWHAPAAPSAPSGGTVIDSEARTAIAGIMDVLACAGILPA